MTNSELTFYVVYINKNINISKEPLDYIDSFIRTKGGAFSGKVPTLAVESQNKQYLIEYFTHKKLIEKTGYAVPGLSYIDKRKPTLEELKKVADISKIIRNNCKSPEENELALYYYIRSLNELEEKCNQEYEDYNNAMDELSLIYLDSGILNRRD